MMSCFLRYCVFPILLLSCGRASAVVQDSDSGMSPVVIDFFHESGCPECRRVRTDILPRLSERFDGFCRVREYDTGMESNLARLLAYQERLNITENKPVLVVVDYRYSFSGYDAIENGLIDRVQQCVLARLAPEWREPVGIRVPVDTQTIEERFAKFTIPMVLVAGLIDGMNPCAITALLFLMTLLAVSGLRGRAVLLIGFAFCVAAFVTYMALGFGLLKILHVLPRFGLLRLIADVAMVVVLAVLSLLSFADAYRYAATGDAGRIRLQLGSAMKKRIHGVMRTGLGYGNLLLGGVFIGAIVTVIESLCTGQVYVPTLVLVIRSGGGGADRAWVYLLVYNAMFIVPMVAVFLLTGLGLKAGKLVSWGKREVIVGKVLLGLFFLAAAVTVARL